MTGKINQVHLSLAILLIYQNVPNLICYKTANGELLQCSPAERSKDETKLCYYHYEEETIANRKTEYPIHPMILARRSHFQQTAEPITDEELMPLFEAMRWAPSSFNTQPWRIVYAHRGSPKFHEMSKIETPRNRDWADHTSVLVAVVTDMYTTYKGKLGFQMSQSFSTGWAVNNLMLEGTARGYLVHIISGFNKEDLAKVLGIHNNKHLYIEFMVCIGRREPTSKLHTERPELFQPRKNISEIVSLDNFKPEWRYRD